MTRTLDQSELDRYTLTGALATGRKQTTVTLCLTCAALLSRKADRLKHQDGITDIRMIRSRQKLDDSCSRCRRRATE
jgi:hypothetical protein